MNPISVTFSVFQEDKPNPSRDLQKSNIPLMLVTLLVSKPVKSRFASKILLSNILSIVTTLLVSKLLNNKLVNNGI